MITWSFKGNSINLYSLKWLFALCWWPSNASSLSWYFKGSIDLHGDDKFTLVSPVLRIDFHAHWPIVHLDLSQNAVYRGNLCREIHYVLKHSHGRFETSNKIISLRLTLGTLEGLQIRSAASFFRISQAKMVGFALLHWTIVEMTSGVRRRGRLPPVAFGSSSPVRWKRLKILLTQPLDTCQCALLSSSMMGRDLSTSMPRLHRTTW